MLDTMANVYFMFRGMKSRWQLYVCVRLKFDTIIVYLPLHDTFPDTSAVTYGYACATNERLYYVVNKLLFVFPTLSVYVFINLSLYVFAFGFTNLSLQTITLLLCILISILSHRLYFCFYMFLYLYHHSSLLCYCSVQVSCIYRFKLWCHIRYTC